VRGLARHSPAREDHLVCGYKPFLSADVNGRLEFRQFLFYERLKCLEVFLLIRIVGSENLQLPHYLVEVLYDFAVWLKVGLMACEEVAALAGFCIDEPGQNFIKRQLGFRSCIFARRRLRRLGGYPGAFPTQQTPGWSPPQRILRG
jgi:hypothetical protein